ncbi:MAG: CoA transferase [Thermomicrobiales bacterium]
MTSGGPRRRRYYPLSTPLERRIDLLHVSTNRNKRGMILDLQHRTGREIALELALRSDVLIENFRAGQMEKWGLGWERCTELNPRLILLCRIGRWPGGPDKDRIGVDLLMQAYAGLMSITGEADGEPVRTGTSVVDLSTGEMALSGILAALYHRERTGEGQRIDVSLLGTTIAWMTYHAVAYFATGKIPGRSGSHHPSVSPYGGYPTGDGYLVVAIAFDNHWSRFCELVGRPDLIDDPRFARNPDRVVNRAELDPIMAEILAPRGAVRMGWHDGRGGIPCSPIHDMAQAMALPQVVYQEYVADVPHPDIPDLRMPGIALKFSATPSTITRHPPKHGEHTAEILAELGFDPGGD